MARTKVDLVQNTWTKVATSVTKGRIGLRTLQPSKIWKTYVLTGAAAPTDGNTTHNPFDLDEAEPVIYRNIKIDSDVLIDVYLFTDEPSGEVVVST
jgi:hypothetical protein